MKRIKWSNRNFNDGSVFEGEFERFFSPASFLGLSKQFNEDGFQIVKHLSERYIITKSGGYNLLHNTCLHKNARLVQGDERAKKGIFICPIHYWSYNFKGSLINAPLSDLDCKRSNLGISCEKEVFEYNGMLFSDHKLVEEIRGSAFLSGMNLSGYSIFTEEKSVYNGNWKEYGIVYNDTNHVKFFHHEMSTVLDIESTEWEKGELYSSHRHRFRPDWRLKPDNNFTRLMKELERSGLCDIERAEKEGYAVIFNTIYPNVFMDVWEGFVWFDIINPLGEGEYENHSIGLCRNDLINRPDIIDLYLSAYERVDSEDREILNRINMGRKRLYYPDKGYVEYITNDREEGDRAYLQWLSERGADFYFGEFSCEDVENR